MRLLIVSAAPIIYKETGMFAYGPYASELQIWSKSASKVAFAAPEWKSENDLLTNRLEFPVAKHWKLMDFDLNTIGHVIKSVPAVIYNLFMLYLAMWNAEHIHLRCPGNIGLLGCIVQIFFPHKKKTAKYAGNWDPNASQPWSYRLQKWLLSNTFLTRNMQVLVYGEWPDQSKNIKPFFTATYSESEKQAVVLRDWAGTIQLLFVGTLSSGKQPLYAVQLAETLIANGFSVQLKLYGEGVEREKITKYIKAHQLANAVFLMGNSSRSEVKEAYQNSHFLILPSLSEGWPKAVAEAMFWGCVPMATAVSCVPYMLERGARGILLDLNLLEDLGQIRALLENPKLYDSTSQAAAHWSGLFTLERFEAEIEFLLNS